MSRKPDPGRYADWGVADWLAWQERLHPASIELGLERVARVAAAMAVQRPASTVITVAGTNGKGSCVAMLSSLLTGSGHRIASYTSPHLLRYNERICIAGEAIGDAPLCSAFAAVEAARGSTSLTYFEFGTLAALQAIAEADVDIALLEVGLGGRLDAVNVIDADAALVSSVDIDHREWLGDDRETIGTEKAGVFRAGAVAVSADPDTPQAVRDRARGLGCHYFERGRDFHVNCRAEDWDWRGPTLELRGLPRPALAGKRQVDNAAGCLMVLDALGHELDADRCREALSTVSVPGRIQQVGQSPACYVDVSHNPAAARALAGWLAGRRQPDSRVHLVAAMLVDKDHAGYLGALAGEVDAWYLAPTTGARGCEAELLAAALGESAAPRIFDSIESAWAEAVASAGNHDIVVACGSFLTVEAVLRSMS